MGERNQDNAKITSAETGGTAGPDPTGSTSTTSEKTGRKATGKPKEVGIENLTGLVDVEIPAEEKPKMKRKKKQTKKQDKKDTMVLESLILTLFSLIASRAGEHWNLEPEEGKQIAEPLSKVLERFEKLMVVNEYSDVIMLSIAIISVTFPRLIITLQARPKRKKGQNEQTGQVEAGTGNDNSENSGNISKSIKADLAGFGSTIR